MPQYHTWEKEYKNPQLVTASTEPQLDFKHFIKWLRKDRQVELDGLRVLDLGSGTGKNAIFLAERGSVVAGLELSDTAVRLAKQRAKEQEVEIEFIKSDIGKPFSFPDEGFDLALDVVSSNSLNAVELEVYLSETNRVLKPGGYFFVKALCKDGDKNAENLLNMNPGPEPDTYTIKEIDLTERVFSKDDFVNFYSKYFKILKLERVHSYTKFQGKSYKRYFWLAYLQK
jgi:ubiquinone/menaquinone biosynthesis C-methylase UbiE